MGHSRADIAIEPRLDLCSGPQKFAPLDHDQIRGPPQGIPPDSGTIFFVRALA